MNGNRSMSLHPFTMTKPFHNELHELEAVHPDGFADLCPPPAALHLFFLLPGVRVCRGRHVSEPGAPPDGEAAKLVDRQALQECVPSRQRVDPRAVQDKALVVVQPAVKASGGAVRVMETKGGGGTVGICRVGSGMPPTSRVEFGQAAFAVPANASCTQLAPSPIQGSTVNELSCAHTFSALSGWASSLAIINMSPLSNCLAGIFAARTDDSVGVVDWAESPKFCKGNGNGLSAGFVPPGKWMALGAVSAYEAANSFSSRRWSSDGIGTNVKSSSSRGRALIAT